MNSISDTQQTSKHTPGPWEKKVYTIRTSGERSVEFWAVNAARKAACTTVYHEATARLIASAPDILAALKACLPCMRDYQDALDAVDSPALDHVTEIVVAMIAAITKAEGGTQ